MTDTSLVALQSSPEEEAPYVASFSELRDAIREAYFSWNTVAPDPGKLVEYLLRHYEFADRLFPGSRGGASTVRTALQMAIGVICGDGNDRSDEADDALASCDEVIAALKTIADVELTADELRHLTPLEREHFERLLDKHADNANAQISHLLMTLDKLKVAKGTTPEPAGRGSGLDATEPPLPFE